jgi:hypothetical protein
MADGLDLTEVTKGMGGLQDTIFIMAIVLAVVFILALLIVVVVNRSLKFATKFDFKGRKSGLIKKLPYWAFIYIKKQGGGNWIYDRWGVVNFEGKKIGALKALGYTFEVPKYADVFPGNFLVAISPNIGEVYPVVLDEETKQLSGKVNYDMVGHVYQQMRSNISTFNKPSLLEKLIPYVAGIMIIFAVMLFSYLMFQQVTTAFNSAASAIQSGLHELAMAKNPPVTPPA